VKDILIVAVNGSPKVDGNTGYMLEQALDECKARGAATEILHCQQIIKDQKNPFCVACASPCPGKCIESKEIGRAYDLITRADGLLVGSPVYFGTVSAQLKAFWDKSRSLRTNKKLLNVVGGALAVGGSRFGGQETTIKTIHDILMVQGMIIIGDGFIEDDCGHIGAAAQRPSREDENAIKRCRILAKRIYEVSEATRCLRKR
jgi:multimeric flavodoxin WrbA